MKVTTVSASARFSKALGDGVHKTVELSAEATVDYAEDWQEAQVRLFQELGQQLKALWTTTANGHTTTRNGKLEGNTNTSNGHYCQQHGVPFQRHEKNGRTWYSHKTDSGEWCRER